MFKLFGFVFVLKITPYCSTVVHYIIYLGKKYIIQYIVIIILSDFDFKDHVS